MSHSRDTDARRTRPPAATSRPPPATDSHGDSSPWVERRLEAMLRSFDDPALRALASRIGVRIDPAKRIDGVTQVARAIVQAPEIREPSSLGAPAAALFHAVAAARGTLRVGAVPQGLDVLVSHGFLFARRDAQGLELLMPTAVLGQVSSGSGEDARSLRALVSQASLETLTAIAGHYLGRPATLPVALALEPALEVLLDDARLRAELAALPPLESRLLQSIEEVGGEVDTVELLDLEKEPLRLRGLSGMSAGRRGAAFALERRGLLVPVHPNRHLIPSEVSAALSESSNVRRATERAAIRAEVLTGDHAPPRARYAFDPAPLALAMATLVRDPTIEWKPTLGTPKSLLSRLTTRVGREPKAVGLLVAVSRSMGLWDASALSVAAPPGSLRVEELGAALYAAWRRSGVWDEARAEPEVLRAVEGAREPSPIGALRGLVEDALRALGDGGWVPWAALERYVLADPKTAAIERLLRRWGERTGLPVPSLAQVVARLGHDSLPALGIIDVGEDDGGALVVRLTPLGRSVCGEPSPARGPAQSAFDGDGRTLTLGHQARVAQVLALASFTNVVTSQGVLVVEVTRASVERAVSAGADPQTLRARLETLAPIAPEAARVLDEVGAVVARASYVQASGFLWIGDDQVRELLRKKKSTADLFVDPSPPGGLLLAPDLELDKVVRRCRALGVEIEWNGEVLRARSVPALPPVGRRSTLRPKGSVKPPPHE
jgi:hypothetical protein